jgi:hypothetical protein
LPFVHVGISGIAIQCVGVYRSSPVSSFKNTEPDLLATIMKR